MKIRPSVQAVIYDENNKKFLLIKKFDLGLKKFCWRLVKGGVEEGETEIGALRREVLEEVGLKNIKISDKVHYYEHPWGGMKITVSAYLVKADIDEVVKLQGESVEEGAIVDHAWLSQEDAVEKVFWDDEKKAITISSQN